MKNPFKNLKLKKKKYIQIQSDKYRYVSILRLLSILIIIILIFAVFGTMYFVYMSVINSISQVQSIALYQSELKIEIIDFSRLAETEKAWEKKYESELPAITRDPFEMIITEPPVEELNTEKPTE